MSLFPETTCDAENLKQLLAGFRFSFASEKDLQDGIAKVLEQSGIAFQREVSLSKADRPDFMVGAVAIEVKVQGSLAALLRQISRYAKHEGLEEIIVVGTPHWLPRVPAELGGKPITSLRLLRSLL